MSHYLRDTSSLSCSITMQCMGTSNGSVIKSDLYKCASIVLGRNEFGELVLKTAFAKQSTVYDLRGVRMHKNFVKEGKATIMFPSRNVQLLVANAAPDKLLLFVRTISAKLAKGGGVKVRRKDGQAPQPMSGRDKLLSGLRHSFEEISPVTNSDLEALQEQRAAATMNRLELTTPPSSKAVQRASSTGTNKENEVLSRVAKPVKRTLSLHSHLSAMTREQLRVLDAVITGKSIFFTGAAGTGKTYLLQRILGSLPPQTTVAAASTGVAACHIGGVTLHSFAGIGSGEQTLEQCAEMASRPVNAARWRRCSHLIVDEVSMVDGRFFAKLEVIARLIRKNDSPFGGIQLILCGDFFQLPPVTKEGTKRSYCFQASCWKKCLNAMIELMEVKRQKDSTFIEVLSHVREGRCSSLVQQTLSAATAREISRDGVVATRLCTHNEDVDALNGMHLSQLSGAVHTFTAVDSDPDLAPSVMNSMCPVPASLELKVGAQVMLAKNLDVQRGLVNGSRGVVIGFQSGNQGYPIVRFYGGAQDAIGCEKWTFQRNAGLFFSRRQLPLKLAWSISIHKSQGMTLDCVEVSLSRAFECGQAYVALSRARTLDGLKVSDFSPSCIRADPRVVEFYASLRSAKTSSVSCD